MVTLQTCEMGARPSRMRTLRFRKGRLLPRGSQPERQSQVHLGAPAVSWLLLGTAPIRATSPHLRDRLEHGPPPQRQTLFWCLVFPPREVGLNQDPCCPSQGTVWVVMTSSGWSPGMLVNTLQHTGQPPP